MGIAHKKEYNAKRIALYKEMFVLAVKEIDFITNAELVITCGRKVFFASVSLFYFPRLQWYIHHIKWNSDVTKLSEQLPD